MASDFSRIRDNVQRMIDLGAPTHDINGYLKTEGLTQTRFKQMMESPTGGIGESLVGGVKRNISSIRTGLASPFGAEEAALSGLERQAKITERPGGSLEEVKRKYREEGILPAAGEAISQIPGVVAEQAPFLAEMWAGAKAGAMLPVPPQFKPFAALGGAALAPFISQAGSNVERQASEQLKQGQPLDVSAGKAYATAVPQAALDVASMELGLGRLLGVSQRTLGTEAAEALARERLIPSIIKGTGKTALAEMPTEVTQQMLERAQAGLSLTDKEAMQEYADAAYQAGLMSPIGGLSRRMEVGDATRAVEAKRQADIAAINAERKQRQATIDELNAQNKANEVPLGLPSYVGETLITFPDGSTATRAEVERYISSLPEQEQIPARAKLLGYEAQKADEQARLGLPQARTETLVSFPDGSVGTRAQAEQLIASLPEEQQVAARAQLLGYKPQQAEQVEPEEPPVLGLPKYQRETMVQFPDGSVGTQAQAKAYIESFPEAERNNVRAGLLGYEMEAAPTKINKTTLTSLVPKLTPQAGIYKRLLNLNVDSAENLAKLRGELSKLGDKYAVNETKLKEIEDAYKATAEREAAKSPTAQPRRETAGDGVQNLGGLGRGTADTSGVAGPNIGGMDVTGSPLSEPASRASRQPTALAEPVAPQSQEVIKAEEAPKQLLQKLAQVSQEQFDGNHPNSPELSTADGTFAGLGELQMDEQGNVILTRVATDMDHLSKGWNPVSNGAQELIETSLSQGGGQGIPTSAISSWGENYQSQNTDNVVAEFKIPAEDLVSMFENGQATIGNVSEGEIVLDPSAARQYLNSINGKPATQEQIAPTKKPRVKKEVESKPSLEELQLTNQAMKQMPGSPAQKATIAKLEKVKQAKKETAPVAPTQAPSPLAALVKSTLETNEAKQKDASKKKKGFAKKEVDDRISNKQAINDHIDKTLTAEEENLVAEELGDGDYEAGKEKLVKLVAQSMAGKAISGIKLAIRNLVKKIQAGLMAFAIAFNFNPSVPVVDIGVPMQVEVSAYSKFVDTKDMPMGDMAQKVANHVLNKGNGKAFIIADKPNEMLYAFNNDGVLLGKTVMLTGKGIGDVRAKLGKSPWEYTDQERVTPAGAFTGKFRVDEHYGSVITLVETRDGVMSEVAIHMTPVFSKQAREAALASPTVSDNRATQGCMNTPNTFYKDIIAPNFQGESQIYVMPDQADAVDFFGVQETVTKTTIDTSKTQPITSADTIVKSATARKEEAVPVESKTPEPLKPAERDPELDRAIEVAKAELGDAIRNTFAVAAMAVPSGGPSGIGGVLKALSNLMFLLIRRGVKSMGQAIKISRQAAGTAANKITPAQYKDAYTEAQKRAETAAPLPSTEQDLFDATAEFVPPQVGKKDSVLDMVENFDTNQINGENLSNFVNDARINVVYSGAGIESELIKQYEGAVTNALTKEVRADILMSQALSSNKLGAESAMDGKIVFDDNGVAKVVDDENNLNAVFTKLASLGERIGADNARHAAQAYLVALRYQSWLALNAKKDQEIAIAKAAGKRALVDKLERQKKYVSEAQEDAIPAGLEFGIVYPEVKEIAAIYDAAKNNEIDMLEQAGYYSKELADEYRKTKGYVPLFRVMDDIENSAPGAKQYFRGFADIGAEKKATGSERQVDDVFDNMMTRHMWAVNAAVRNRANKAVANQLGIVDEEGELILTDKPAPGAENSSAPVWIDGERKYVQYSDPKFAVGIQGLEPALGPLMSMFAGASRVLRMGVTMLPPFQLAMVFHDAPRAALNSGVERPFQLMGKVVSSFAAILKDPNDPFVKEMKRLGITGGYGHTAEEVSAKLRRDLGLQANGMLQKALDKAETFAAASDMAQRRAVYMQTMEETGNQVLAMHRALDIINFQKHGSSAKIRALTQVVPFMNAYLQGMDVLYKAMSGKGISGKEKRQAQTLFIQTAIKLAALSALYSMLVADDDDYKKLDDREKVRSLIIPGTGIKIPVAPDVAMLVKAIPELGYQYIVNSGTETPMDATKLFQGISQSFVDGMLGPNLMPQALRSGFEVAVNKNFMTGNPIVGRGLENLETSQQFTENTSRLARLIGQTGVLSPMNADHLMKGYGGTAASLFLYTTDGLVNQVADVKTPATPVYRIPSINAFMYSRQGKDQLNDYYDLKDRSDEVAASLNNLKKYGSPDEARAYAEENKEMLSVRGRVNALSNTMKTLREQRKRIVASDLDASAKRERLDEIDTRIAKLVENIGLVRERAGL